jgi:hypothetical protein
MGLSAAQRAVLRDFEQPTEDLTDALNALLALDASDYPEAEEAA